MRKILFVIAVIYCLLLAASCSTHKVNCVSSRMLPVTFITKSGGMYTLNVPFCDTVRLSDEKIPDSVKAEIKLIDMQLTFSEAMVVKDLCEQIVKGLEKFESMPDKDASIAAIVSFVGIDIDEETAANILERYTEQSKCAKQIIKKIRNEFSM